MPAGVPAKHKPPPLTRTLRHRPPIPDPRRGDLEADIRRLCARANPALLAAKGVGPDTASALLAAARQPPNEIREVVRGAVRRQPRPGIIRTNGSASSQPGRQPPSQPGAVAEPGSATQQYVAKREAEGKNRKEIIRWRHIAPQIYRLITNPPPTPNARTHPPPTARPPPSRISALELSPPNTRTAPNPPAPPTRPLTEHT